MFSKVARTAPRLFQVSLRLNQLPALCRASSSSSAKVIESNFQPSGQIPHDESYHQIPCKINGNEYVVDPDLLETPYPFVPTLEEISIERQPTDEEKEIEPEFQPKTLEDKCRVWFGADMPTKFDDQRPDRDLVNYPRLPPNLVETSPARLYFLPEAWFKFFESKTGRTGGYVFGFTFWTFFSVKRTVCLQ